MEKLAKRPVMLCILDGWGLPTGSTGDALTVAHTPIFDELWQSQPTTTLVASGEAVGLPEGNMGNSEVGHLNIGAGRIVYQDLTKITKAIKDGDFFTNSVLMHNMQAAIDSGTNLHLFGLLSDGGVHSHIFHIKALLKMAKDLGVKQTYVHCFLDGRDVSPVSGKGYLEELQDYLVELNYGRIATVIGRFYAMDRDKRWDRVEKAWRALVLGEGRAVAHVIAEVQASYDQGVTDEFVEPIIPDDLVQLGRVQQGDSMIFANFRADRAREITRAMAEEDFVSFPRPVFPKVNFCCLTEYDATFPLPVAFYKTKLVNTLGETLAKAGKKQLRIAETEKYAHVTFFFNGGVEEPNINEDRILIPSPKVKTYDLQPEMSAFDVAETVIEKIEADTYEAIILNFANPDMVGHTGVLSAAVQAVETIDKCLGRVVQAVVSKGGGVLITADHGNVERMLDDSGKPVTAHTVSDVPCILVGVEQASLRAGGSLQDIAPTLLELLDIAQPEEMSGKSLIKFNKS